LPAVVCFEMHGRRAVVFAVLFCSVLKVSCEADRLLNCTAAGPSRSREQLVEFLSGADLDAWNSKHDSLPSWLPYNVLLMILAFMMGLGKGGVPGSSTTSVALNALYAPDGCLDLATALQVPVTTVSDCAVVVSLYKSARWDIILRLFPGAGLGIALGSQLVGGLSAAQSKTLVGGLLACILVLNFMEEFKKDDSQGKKDDDKKESQKKIPAYAESIWFVSFVGVVGGFATILTNSMGPMLNAFFVLLDLNKDVFVGTRATFFTTINFVKLAQRLYAGTLSVEMLILGLKMALVAAVGVFASKPIMRRMSKSFFMKCQYLSMVYASGKLLYAGLS